MAQYPDATDTGVPAGVTLTPYYGELEITQAGTVISGLDIHGVVTISAPNVTIENCRITAANFAVINITDVGTSTVVQNCEINGIGTGNEGSDGIYGAGTFLNNDIYNVENGIAVTGSSTITGNYIHDLLASGSPHYDGIQIDGGVSNVVIRHNTVINNHTSTSAIMIDNAFGPISNIQVDDNLLVGGGYTVYSDATQSPHPALNPITGVSFTNNHIGGGYWGLTAFDDNAPIYTGNVDDGVAVAATLATVPCFYEGTKIATPTGEVAVERLKRGDLVLTSDGRALPVTWLGRQTLSRLFANPLRALPIRIKSGALADNVPSSDLLLSLDHAVLINGVLVQAGALVNGRSIVRENMVPINLTYYHVELDEHAVVLAENTPAESFIDNVDRLGFDNGAEHAALYPDGKPLKELPYPRAKSHRQVPANIRVILAERANVIGAALDNVSAA